MKNTDQTRAIISGLLIVLLFIGSSLLVHQYEEPIKENLSMGIGEMPAYILLAVIATVIAPVSMMPLIPMAAMMWGWQTAALISALGWFIGACIAFWLARQFGVPLLQKITNVDHLKTLENYVPEKNVFWSIVLLRATLPVDILSYALGLFSRISFSTYALATALGILPFAFIFAYVGTIPLLYQIVALVAIGIFVFICLRTYHKRAKKQGL